MDDKTCFLLAYMLSHFVKTAQRKKSVSLDYSNISDKWLCMVSDCQRVDDEEGTTYYFTGGGIGESLDPVEAMRVGLRLSDEEFRDIQEKVRGHYDLWERLCAVERERDELRCRFTRKIVCLCGSTRFYRTFREFNKRLTLGGFIVLSVGCEYHSDEGLGITHEQKLELDILHKCKIDLADEVLVLDVNGYIGESTRSEIEYATAKGKPVRYLSREFPDYQEPADPIVTERDSLRAQLAEAEAGAARLRRAVTGLIEAIRDLEGDVPDSALVMGVYGEHIGECLKALSEDAGRETLERLRSGEAKQPADLAALEHEVEELRAACATIYGALEKAVSIIRQWHGLKLPDSIEERIWNIYFGNAPEMAAIRQALSSTPDSVRQLIARYSALGGQEARL